MLRVHHLTCEFQEAPLGIASERPLLQWKLHAEGYGVAQSAYRVCVASTPDKLDAPDLWDSGRVLSPKNRAVYEGRALASNQQAYWRVRVWADDHDACSEIAAWRQGVRAEDWRGAWIGYDEGRDKYDPSVPYYCADDFEKGENHPFLPKPAMLRGAFTARNDVVSATLYVSALGLATAYLNGERVTRDNLVPGNCDYRKRAYYRAYDVTRLVHSGNNAIGAVLADGWYAGYIGLNPRQWWGAKPRLNAQLELVYQDGSRQTVATDESWRAATGAWLYADIMHGAGYDATLEREGWSLPDYDAEGWQPVATGAEHAHIPCAHPGVPIVETDRYPAKEIKYINDDEAIVDFGCCFAGVICATVIGTRGARIDLWHAEELTRDGKALYLRGNRSAQAHDLYVLRGGGEESFEPEFTYHGFRYAHIKGLRSVKLVRLEGIAFSSALPDRTALHSGNRVVESVVQMIVNTQKSNMHDMPTDVCARDERLGWGAEGHFFMHTAAALGNTALFLRKWLADILDGQMDNGCFWAIAPAVMMKDILPFAGDIQSDMGLHCAWLLMRYYGDMEPVRSAFPALERSFDFSVRNSDRLLRFATSRDWLDLGHGGRSDFDHGYGKCDPTLLGTAWFAHGAQMMADIAASLGMDGRAAYYRELYQSIRAAFRTYFLGRNLLLRDCTQGGYLAAAAFGLISGAELQAAAAWVREDMRRQNGITWGTITTPVALRGMCALGMQREAAAFVRSESYPSIGYMHKCGATSVWERWDAIYEGEFHPHVMNAFNHIGFATVGEWVLSGLAGIQPDTDGFDTVLLEPVLDRDIGSMCATYESVHGSIEVEWAYHDDSISLKATLPVGTQGRLVLPFSKAAVRFTQGEQGMLSCRATDGGMEWLLACGAYQLRID